MTTSVAAEPAGGEKRSALEPVRASQLEVRPVQWLWPGLVPQGGLTVLAGEPGLGKSLLSLWLASRLSRGELGGTPAASLFLTAEDSREHTVLPRLVAAGAELEQVSPTARGRWAGKNSPTPRRRRLPARADHAHDGEVGRLRPAGGVPGREGNTWQDHSLRAALAPLAALAEEQGTDTVSADRPPQQGPRCGSAPPPGWLDRVWRLRRAVCSYSLVIPTIPKAKPGGGGFLPTPRATSGSSRRAVRTGSRQGRSESRSKPPISNRPGRRGSAQSSCLP